MSEILQQTDNNVDRYGRSINLKEFVPVRYKYTLQTRETVRSDSQVQPSIIDNNLSRLHNSKNPAFLSILLSGEQTDDHIRRRPYKVNN